MLGGYALVDVIMIIFAVVITLTYTFRGFLKSVIQFFKTLIACYVAYLFGGRVGEFFCQRFFGSAIRNFVYERVNGIYAGTVDSVNVDAVTEKIPGFMMTEQVKANLASVDGSGEQLVNSITDAIATPAASSISGVVGYVVVFLAAAIVLSLAVLVLNTLIDKIKIFKTVNTILGAVFGLLLSFLVLCVFSSAVKALMGESDFYVSSQLMKYLGDSAFLEKIRFLDVSRLIKI